MLATLTDRRFSDPGWLFELKFGGRVGFGALLSGYYDSGNLRYAGKVGTRYDTRTLIELGQQLRELEMRNCPFADRVREKDAHWVRPELVAEVGFAEWTADGKPRHPRFLGLRDDKPAHVAVRERGT